MLIRWAKEIAKKKPYQNFVFLFLIQTSNILISLVTIPIVFDAIGVEQFGYVSLSLSIITMLNVVVGFGYHLSGPKDVAMYAENQAELSHIFSKILTSRIVLATIIFGGLMVTALTLNVFSGYRVVLLFSSALLFSEAIFPTWLAQGLQKMQAISLGNLISKAIYLALLVWLVKSPSDAWSVNFFLGISSVLVNEFLVLSNKVEGDTVCHRGIFDI